ncbi:hypothetical protein GCM10010193_09010 [Kitasatospora atroaurantiaca]|uniref:Uncharacterized protein n=1 Tax=Kitasatospora atroaurantiaca TaxID=285545 RepID=A0A561ERW8_9ACTN|nr:hypothetical protein [Kitasatospora atroaurantiaca]TWE18353.1 hypothetical protein FB465_3420 [Kitasatospora atroaurantiaca]
MFRATAQKLGGPPAEGRTFETADIAAHMLFILINAAGWTDSEESALDVLRSGEPLVFKRFEYRVTEEPQDVP